MIPSRTRFPVPREFSISVKAVVNADSGVPITYTMIKPIAPTPMIGIISVGSSDFNAIGRLIFFNRFTR